MGIIWPVSNDVTCRVRWAREDPGTNNIWNNQVESFSGNGTNTMFDPIGPVPHFQEVFSIY